MIDGCPIEPKLYSRMYDTTAPMVRPLLVMFRKSLSTALTCS